MNEDSTNKEYGKVLIYGHKEWYITNNEISIFDKDTLVGKINRNGLLQYKVNQDTTLVFKSGLKRAEIQVRCDINNEIFLSYNSNIDVKVVYTKDDLNYDEALIEIQHKEYSRYITRLYYVRRFICWFCGIMFFIVFIEMDSSIFKWVLEIVLLYLSLKYTKNTDYKIISGPKCLFITDDYDIYIMKKLIPRLHQYLNMSLYPIKTDGTYQKYCGYDENNCRVEFTFHIAHKHLINKNKYRRPMLVIVDYVGKDIFSKEIGEIDLTTRKNVDKAVELIVSSLDLKPRIVYSNTK